MRKVRVPRLCLHRATGQAFVRVGGRHKYLGRHGTPQAEEAYRRLVADLMTAGAAAAPARPRGPSTVAEGLAGYEAWARERYVRQDGTPTMTMRRVSPPLKLFVELHGKVPLARAGAAEVDAARRAMAARGWNRVTVACAVGVLRRCWRWLVSRGLAPAESLAGVEALEGLRPGQYGVREATPRRAVPDDEFFPVLARLRACSPRAARLARAQWATGMRTGEALGMLWEEIDWSGERPLFRPRLHKMAHAGLGRVVVLFPEAVEELTPRGSSGLVFPTRTGRRLTSTDYARSVRRACKAAGVPRWSPYELRHAAATRFERQYGRAVAAMLLGHAPGSKVTDRYVHRDPTADLLAALRGA